MSGFHVTFDMELKLPEWFTETTDKLGYWLLGAVVVSLWLGVAAGGLLLLVGGVDPAGVGAVTAEAILVTAVWYYLKGLRRARARKRAVEEEGVM